MSTPSLSLNWRALLAFLALLGTGLVPSCQISGMPSSWSRPTRRPRGRETRWWEAGLAGVQLRRQVSSTDQPDGSCVHTVECSGSLGTLYVWDRISNDYNSPAVVSRSPDFSTYVTLDHRNRPFATSIYRQLRAIWEQDPTRAQLNLIRKLRDEVDEASRD